MFSCFGNYLLGQVTLLARGVDLSLPGKVLNTYITDGRDEAVFFSPIPSVLGAVIDLFRPTGRDKSVTSRRTP